jgi:hypothetical protein
MECKAVNAAYNRPGGLPFSEPDYFAFLFSVSITPAQTMRLGIGRLIFGWHLPFHVAQIRDARALDGKLAEQCNPLQSQARTPCASGKRGVPRGWRRLV